MTRHDVIILGAGIIGLSIAWQIARRSKLSVLVLERAPSLGAGSTGASSAVLRHRYSTDHMTTVARDGIALYRQWQAFTGLSDPAASFQHDGILWLPGDTEWAAREQQRLNALSIRAEVLNDRDLQTRFPALSPCVRTPDVETGEAHACEGGGQHLLEPDAGWMDPVLAAEDLRRACLHAGVTVQVNAEVTTVLTDGGRVSGVQLASGDCYAASTVVNAMGPWCLPLYRKLGLDIRWDIAPIRIQVLYLDRPEALTGHIPVTADIPGGIYFRTQNRGQQLIVSSVLESDERETVDDPDTLRRETDTEFEQRKLHMLHHRLPAMPYRGKVRGYCGLYTTNRDDVHPILGETELSGLWAANGFSGHGFKLAPQIGAMLASAITQTALSDDTTVPLSTYGINRQPINLPSKSVLA